MRMFQKNNDALSERQRMHLRRRRLLHLRRALLLLACAAILALLIATPVWIIRATRDARGERDNAKSNPPDTSQGGATDTEGDTLPDVNDSTVILGSEIQSEYAVLLDVTAGRVVAAKNANVQANPASITKVMTLLVAVENIADLDAEYTVPWQVTTHVASDATRAGLNSGDVFTLRDLLYGCILPSGADAAVALAHYVMREQTSDVAEAEALFAQKMNERAAELGAKNTHFVNVSGLHDRNHKTTAMDMALMMAAAVQNEVCREVLAAANYSSENTLRLPPAQLSDGTWHSTLFTGWLGADREGILAGKTGYTDQALHTLATYTEIDGHKYVFVSMRVNGSDKAVADARTVYTTYCGDK